MGADRKNTKNQIIQKKIQRYGSAILHSESFDRAAHQRHHICGTVSEHTLTVCTIGLRIARLLNKAGFNVNEKDLVEGSLCHDLGMIGRDEKYNKQTKAWKMHPKESLKAAREIVPDLSQNAETMILSHMWPIGGPRPRSREAVILNIADKLGSLADWKNFLVDKIKNMS